MDKKLITVTSPLLPNLDDFHAELQKIWDSKWITNNCLLYTSPSPRDPKTSRMPSSA